MARIGVIGLGTVGLPLAVALARRFPGTLGHDRDPARLAELRAGRDRTRAVPSEALAASGLALAAALEELAGCDVYVVCVPTAPGVGGLRALEDACSALGALLAPGDVVVIESTVPPGTTESVCGRLLALASGLAPGAGFGLAHSPERINPGDPERSLEAVVKVVGASDPATLARVAALYRAVVPAGVHEAPSIAVAEAAKLLENAQRDVNAALMNEVAPLLDRLGLDTGDVLDAAATKWNFHRYRPGLVGGQCIGACAEHLAGQAEALGLEAPLLRAARAVNDATAALVARRTAELLDELGRPVAGARVAVLGLTFKPDVPDARDSRVPALVRGLEARGARVVCHDPLADPEQVRASHGLEPVGADALGEPDALVLAVPHAALMPLVRRLLARRPALVVDLFGVLDARDLPEGVRRWRL